MTALAFLDTETTGLDPTRHEVWEIAVIRRERDGSETDSLWQLRVPLETADPEALKISRYHERFAVRDTWDAAAIIDSTSGRVLNLSLPELLFDVQDALADAVVVGSNPGFDLAFLTALLKRHGRRLPWHYRPADVATLAAGWLHGAGFGHIATVPYSSRDLSRAVGVEPPSDDTAHTALGDARWARDVYDAITGGGW